jgi:hypothetical protein
MYDKKDSQSPEIAILDMIAKGQLITRSISVVTNLKIADYLVDGPKSIDQLAEKTNSHPDSLYRILRMLSSVGIFAEVKEEEEEEDNGSRQFKLTPMASLLQSNEKNSIKNLSLLLNIESFKRALDDLLYTVQTGENAFKHANDLNLFEYLQLNQKDAEIFNNAMTSLTSSQVSSISSMYDFSQFNSIVDIGGGQGSLLFTILKNNSKLHGILFDLPYAIESAKNRIESDSSTLDSSIGSRCKLIAGDFFKSIPSGSTAATADGYILKNVILNWDDKAATVILKNCLQAMKSIVKSNQEGKQKVNTKLLIIDVIMPPEGNEAFIGKFLDIQMLVLTQSGKIRTEKEFSKLLNSCGFDITNIIRSSDPMNFLSIIEATPS